MKITFSQLLSGAALVLAVMLPIGASAEMMFEEIIVEESTSSSQTEAITDFEYSLGEFDVGEGDFLVVAVAFEGGSNGSFLSFNGADPVSTTASSRALVEGEQQTSIFTFEDVSGSGELTLFTTAAIGLPGFYAASLSNVAGVETTGSGARTGQGDLVAVLDGVGEDSFVVAAFSDNRGGDSARARAGVNIGGNLDDLTAVDDFGIDAVGTDDDTIDFIGGAIGAVATGFGPSEEDLAGQDLEIFFSDVSPFAPVALGNERSNFSFVSLAPVASVVPEPSSVIVLALAGLAATTRRRR